MLKPEPWNNIVRPLGVSQQGVRVGKKRLQDLSLRLNFIFKSLERQCLTRSIKSARLHAPLTINAPRLLLLPSSVRGPRLLSVDKRYLAAQHLPTCQRTTCTMSSYLPNKYLWIRKPVNALLLSQFADMHVTSLVVRRRHVRQGSLDCTGMGHCVSTFASQSAPFVIISSAQCGDSPFRRER